ncbi:hypothetical protein [Marinobacterium sp. BA1]|uniref:hypothetical protein n=1 Tax=Marinobacterium sp. BA1 TaxID=3138931 RepID=UPI0032E7ABF6
MTSKLDAVIAGLSPQRLGPYLNHSKGDRLQALAQYHWNLQLSEALYPLLHLNEVVFRNALHNALTIEFETENWFQGLWLHSREQQAINKVLSELHKRKQAPTADRVIAELTFGFWCSLCDSRYEHKQILWPKLLKHAPLKQLPKRQRQRKEISRAVNRLRQLRNRVFHHEPIWHWRDLPQRHTDAGELLTWLNPEIATLLQHSDRFTTIYRQGMTPLIQELYR